MDNFTQLGFGGLALGIIYFMIRYFIDAQKEARKDAKELTEKFIEIAEKTLDVQNKSTQSTDKLTEMIYKIIKQ